MNSHTSIQKYLLTPNPTVPSRPSGWRTGGLRLSRGFEPPLLAGSDHTEYVRGVFETIFIEIILSRKLLLCSVVRLNTSRHLLAYAAKVEKKLQATVSIQ